LEGPTEVEILLRQKAHQDGRGVLVVGEGEEKGELGRKWRGEGIEERERE
jgi:hypothetical protein